MMRGTNTCASIWHSLSLSTHHQSGYCDPHESPQGIRTFIKSATSGSEFTTSPTAVTRRTIFFALTYAEAALPPNTVTRGVNFLRSSGLACTSSANLHMAYISFLQLLAA